MLPHKPHDSTQAFSAHNVLRYSIVNKHKLQCQKEIPHHDCFKTMPITSAMAMSVRLTYENK